MRGTKAKAIRKAARQRAFVNQEKQVAITRIAPLYMTDPETGDVKLDDKGEKVILIPAQMHYTHYWPFMHFRRQLKFLKRGERITGLKYMGGGTHGGS
jgi:hypothetical protein